MQKATTLKKMVAKGLAGRLSDEQQVSVLFWFIEIILGIMILRFFYVYKFESLGFFRIIRDDRMISSIRVPKGY